MSQFNFVVKMTTDYFDKQLHTGVDRPIYSTVDLVKLLGCAKKEMDGEHWDTINISDVFTDSLGLDSAISEQSPTEDKLVFMKFVYHQLSEFGRMKVSGLSSKQLDPILQLINQEIKDLENELKDSDHLVVEETRSKANAHGHIDGVSRVLEKETESKRSQLPSRQLKPADRIATHVANQGSLNLRTPLRPGFFLIMGKSGSGKTKLISKLHQAALKRSFTSDGIIFASEPDHRSQGRGIDVLLAIIGVKSVVFVDSIRDVVYLQDNLVSGGISAQLFDIVTTMSAYCMRCNVTCVAAINPTVDDNKVYESLFHMLKSSSTGVYDTTKNLGSYRHLVTESSGGQHYDRIETDSILQMLGFPEDATLNDVSSSAHVDQIPIFESQKPHPTVLFMN